MATKKKAVKVRDLKPSKDAKGGMSNKQQGSTRQLNSGRFNTDSNRGAQAASRNLL